MQVENRETPRSSHEVLTARPAIVGRLLPVAGLFGLVAGVPFVLIASHLSPPLQELMRLATHPHSWGSTLRSPLGDDTVLKVVALIAWAAWAWLALCIGAELLARLRGVPTVRLPGSRYGQSVAAFLVGASLALVPSVPAVQQLRLHASDTVTVHSIDTELISHSLRDTEGAPVSLDLELGPARIGPDAQSSSGSTLKDARSSEWKSSDWNGEPTATDASEVLAVPVGGGTYLVVPGDTLWSIASRVLGSPLRWRELAALNMGRPQPDGRELTDAHWIFPGWVLLLPPSTASSDVEAPSRFGLPAQTQESLSDSPPQATAFSDPVSPRQAAAITDQPAPPRPAPRTDRVTRPASAIKWSSAAGQDSRPIREGESGFPSSAINGNRAPSPLHRHQAAPTAPIAPIGYGILGAAVVAVIDRMRRAQQRHRRSGLRIALPEAELAELEHGLRLGADTEAVQWIDLGQRLLSSRALTDSSGTRPPRIVGVRLRPEILELLLEPSSSCPQPPEPFERSARGASWVLRKDPELLERLQCDPRVVGAQAPLPSLVTLGRDQHGLLLLDVERAGSLAISGREAEQLAQAMAIEMACSRWSDQVDLVVVGLEAELEGLERITRAPSVASVVQRLERRVRERKALLEIVQHATNSETRWIEGGDAWDLCVVFCMPIAASAEVAAVDELIQLAGDGSYGLAVVCASDAPQSRTHLRVDGGPVSFEMGLTGLADTDGSVLWPQRVERDFAGQVASLIDVAARTDGVSPDSPPYDQLAIETPEASTEASSSSNLRVEPSFGEDEATSSGIVIDRANEIEVRVLGPVEIVGAARPFTRAWAVELVVYLAMHRNGASTEKWSFALWPERALAPATLHSTASAARRALGVSPSGEDHLPRAHGRLALGAGVKSDWEQFVWLSRSAQQEDWRRALELVRGRPFDGLRAPDWALLEGITATIEALVVDLSCRYSEACLSNADPVGAEWAARQGLRVSAYDERLYRILLRAADAAGNPAGVESLMSELAHLVNEEVEPIDAVHPETLELYRSLSRRPFASRDR